MVDHNVDELLEALKSGDRPLSYEETGTLLGWFQGLTPNRQAAIKQELLPVLAELREERLDKNGSGLEAVGGSAPPDNHGVPDDWHNTEAFYDQLLGPDIS